MPLRRDALALSLPVLSVRGVSNLVGGTDSPSSYDDANALNVTWHHNHWADKADDGKGTPFAQPPYSYAPDATAGLAAKIRAQVGPR